MKPLIVLLLASLMAVPFLPTASAVPPTYTQSVWFNWNHKDLDILILDVHDPIIGAAIERGMEIWMNSLDSAWSGHGITFRTYWADSGAALPSGFRPDVVWVPQGFAAVSPILGACTVTAPMAVGWGSFVRVTSHEFGHCLGLTHVFSNGVEYKPSEDIMGDGDGERCASNLNIDVLQMAFGAQTGTVSMSSTDYAQETGC